MLRTIYLDHNATAPLHPDLKSKLPEWADFWGNPSSIHWAGRAPKTLYREAKQKIADLLGVAPLELIFTSGGSESNNLALKGLCEKPMHGRDQILISAVEHPALRKTADYLKGRGFRVDVIPVNREGQLDMQAFDNLLSEKTYLVSVMLANNETGHILPVAEVARRAHIKGALVHCDAVQALGKIPLNLPELGADLVSLSGHKFYALKGCGVLYVRRGINLQSLIHGGGQERGRRAGTENLIAIASLGFMCGKGGEIAEQALRLRELRDHMEERVLKEISGVTVTGQMGSRVPNTSSMILQGVDGETLLMNLDVRGFAVSTGAACSSGNPEPSPVLLAMGLTRDEAQSSLRLSLGWFTTREEVDAFVDELKKVVERLRGFKHGERFAYGV